MIFLEKKMLKIFWKKGSIIAPNKINSFLTCKTSTLSYSSMTMIKTSATHTAIILTDWPFKHSPSKQMSCIYLSFSFLVKRILVPCEDYKFSHFPYWYWCAVFFCLLMPFCLYWIFTSSLSDFNELFFLFSLPLITVDCNLRYYFFLIVEEEEEEKILKRRLRNRLHIVYFCLSFEL